MLLGAAPRPAARSLCVESAVLLRNERMRRLRVLVLASYPERAACTRFRVTEYARHLAERGIDLRLCPALDDEAFARFYRSGSRLEKGAWILRGAGRQLGALA